MSQTDNGIGYGTENALDNTATTVSTVGAAKRQLDKIAAGEQTLSNAAGTGADTSTAITEEESLDGQLTGDASTAGQQVGDDEAATLESAGSLVPKKL